MAVVPTGHIKTIDDARRAIQKLASNKLGPNASPTFYGLTLTTPLTVPNGGTGLATLTDHGLLLGSGTGIITPLAEATDGQIPIGDTDADPVLATITGTANRVTVSNAAGSITLTGPQDIHTSATPTFAGLHINSAEVSSVTLLTLESDISNNNEYNEILFKIAGGVNYGAIRSCVGLTAGDSYMSFFTTTNGGTLVRQMTIQHDGKVGIGTASPSQKLDIVAGNSGVLISDTGEGRGVAKSLFFGDGGGAWTPIIWGVAGAFDDAGLHFLAETEIADDSGTEPLIRLNARRTNSSPITTRPILAIENDRNQLVTVDKDGNVGIGITPVTTLTVNGTITLPATNEINFRDSDISIGSTLFDGTLDISADISVGFFYDNADVGDAVDGQSLYINRRAAEGDDYLQFYIGSDRDPIINASQSLKIQRQGITLLLLEANVLTVNGNIAIGGSNNELRFYEGANYVGFEAPTLSADQIWVLPTADGNADEIIKTDGAGTLSFIRMSKAIYAELSDSTDQTFAATGTAYSITFDTNDEIAGITHSTSVNPENITIDTTGVYTIFAQPQVAAAAGGAGVFHMWLQKDTGGGFADIANTNIELSLASLEEDVIPLATTFMLSAGDIIRLRASISDIKIKLDAQTPASEPAIPSIIFTMFMIGT